MNTTIYNPTWVDKSLYPFTSKYIQLQTGKMHYIDEGKGAVILFVHGTPTWSFLYRNFVKKLSKNYRCIAIDHLGFGLSEKPKTFEGSPEQHSKNLSEFMSKLDLKNIALVVHDFGGPIGLGAGIKNQERVDKIVLFNSWLWATKTDKKAQKIDKMINSWLGKFLYLNLNFSPKVLLKKGFADKNNLPKNVHQHYTKPFPNKSSRVHLLNIGKSLVGSSDWYEEQWQQLDKLADKEWLILWGTKDKFIKSQYLEKWEKRFTKAKIIKFDTGHFIQEEESNRCIEAISNFVCAKKTR